MLIRMKADVSGARNGVPWPRRGGTLDVPDAEGADLCAAGIAEPVAASPTAAESATVPDDSEKRTEPEPKAALTSDTGPAVAKKAAPARKTAAKKTTP